jgi:hypothetical protein
MKLSLSTNYSNVLCRKADLIVAIKDRLMQEEEAHEELV